MTKFVLIYDVLESNFLQKVNEFISDKKDVRISITTRPARSDGYQSELVAGITYEEQR